MYKLKFIPIIICILFILSGCQLFSPSSDIPLSQSSASDSQAQFHFIDVGQGDCIFITDGDINILIDSGTESGGSDAYRYLKELGIKKLNYFIGTHPHDDHMGGAAAILSSIEVSKVFINNDTSNAYFYERFLDTLIEKEITPLIPNTDCVYEIGSFRIRFLTPAKDFGDTNNNSIVTMVQYGDIKALFMADCEREDEAYLLESGVDLDSDILKVGHHGSRYASSAAFLNAVTPSVAVIQSKEGNSYGHPHEEAVERLSNIGAEILRNDKSGNIVLTTDGKTIFDETGVSFKKIEASEIELIYIGNRKSKTFHSEACPNLPSDKNRIVFSMREDAINQGYKPCGNCNP